MRPVDMLKQAVRQALDLSDVNDSAFLHCIDIGKLDELIGRMIEAAKDAASWGFPTIGIYLSDEELGATALKAVIDVLAERLPFEGPSEIMRHALGSFTSLEDLSDEEIESAVYHAAQDLGLELRTSEAVAMLDEAGKLVARMIEL